MKLLHICDDLDPELTRQEAAVEKQYRELKGEITVIRGGGERSRVFSPKSLDAVVGFVQKNSALHS